MTNSGETKIKDLGIAAVLKALSFPLERVEEGMENGKRFFIFVFSDTGKNSINSTLSDYWASNCYVEAKGMLESLRDLKTLIHQMNFN
jgi:hypothetical protein